MDFECIWRDWKEPPPFLPEGSVHHRQRHTFCPSRSCRSGSCLMLSPLPTFPSSLLLKVFPLCHPMCTDLFSWNLILHGSFSLQRLARTFHFDPLSEGTQCISDWTGYTRWSQPFLCCSHSAAWQGIPLQRQLWALGTTQRVTHCRGSCWPSQGNAGKCFQGCSLFRAGIRLQDLLANQPHFLILYS